METKYYSDHYIICGYGKLGEVIANEFVSTGKPCLFIENNKETCQQLERNKIPYVFGNAHDKDILIKAGIKHAKGIVITFSKDSEVLYTVFSVKELSSELNIVCRATRKETSEKLKELGVKKVLMLDELVSNRIMAHIMKPSLASSLDLLTNNDQNPIMVEEIVIDNSFFINKEFKCLQKALDSKVIILGLRRGDAEDYIFNPKPSTNVSQDDVLVVMGTISEIDALKSLVNKMASY